MSHPQQCFLAKKKHMVKVSYLSDGYFSLLKYLIRNQYYTNYDHICSKKIRKKKSKQKKLLGIILLTQKIFF